ncbi:MAG: sulfatase-like hydrolase/transferase [Planctomycetes bacterium]|nr:sulfatase-like hydrolase/transferase [Planctomycetota bacterium]
MDNGRSKSGSKGSRVLPISRLYDSLAARPYSVIMFGALFYTLGVKFFHSWRNDLVNEYVGWVLADISVLLGFEVILALLCFGWPRKLVVRITTIFAAVIYAWSVMNAGWLIRMGWQILPSLLLSAIRDPLIALVMVGDNLKVMPKAAVILLGPSAVALTFFFFVLAKPKLPNYNQKRFIKRTIICIIIILATVSLRDIVVRRTSPQTISEGMRYNCHLKAITSIFFSDPGRLARADFANAKRTIPAFDEIQTAFSPRAQRINYNVVIVVLEGVQYRYTSLAEPQSKLTPFLASVAQDGVEFVNTRSTLTHTTKVLFSLLTGRFPSASQDLAETVPAAKPYAGIVTILKHNLNYRTAFFQSAKGNFEARPGLVYNLGFDKFWARDDLNDPNAFLGYLACDEFSMLKPISEWIKAEERPFLLTILCSVTHDPYEVPEWFAEPAKEPVERYRQTIAYTDKFLAALEAELAKLNLVENTILCVVGDHGEAFGEHFHSGHERIAFEEVLRIPFCLRAPSLVKPATKVTKPVSSVDLAPTLLTLLGFDTNSVGFDGTNALGNIADDRKVYFSGWVQQGPVGFVRGDRKFIYNPMDKMVSEYGLSTDPFELVRIELAEQEAQKIADDIIAWRKNSIFRLNQQRTGRKVLFDYWHCRWNNRVTSAKYRRTKNK